MLNYTKYDNNKNKWVVFVHGIAGSTLTWKRQIEDFSREYNLLLIDLPGHGDSQGFKLEHINPFKLSKSIKEILDCESINSASFIGMSMGTLVIAHFAITYPSYVEAIVFGGAAIKVQGIYKGLMKITQAIKNILPKTFLCKTLSFVMMPKSNHKKSRQIFLRESKKINKENFLAWVEFLKATINPEQIFQKLNKTEIKTIFISGDEDNCFVKGAKSICNKMKNAKFSIIKKCGHVCTIERAKEFNCMALGFLRTA